MSSTDVDDAGFLAAIQADRSALERLLVYADWLEEQGDPRAEYVRLVERTLRRGFERSISRSEADEVLSRESSLDSAWVAGVAGVYTAHLERPERGQNYFSTIKRLKDALVESLMTCKQFVDLAPIDIMANVTLGRSLSVKAAYEGESRWRFDENFVEIADLDVTPGARLVIRRQA